MLWTLLLDEEVFETGVCPKAFVERPTMLNTLKITINLFIMVVFKVTKNKR